MILHTTLNLEWTPLVFPIADPAHEKEVSKNISNVLQSWEGTSYGSGQDCKGVLADCIGFACRVLDELRCVPPKDLNRLPTDVCFHAPETARAAMHELLRLYAPVAKVPGPLVEPLDIIITGPEKGGPGHIMLVGTQRNTLWHCNKTIGVRWTGFSLVNELQSIVAIYRPLDKESWR